MSASSNHTRARHIAQGLCRCGRTRPDITKKLCGICTKHVERRSSKLKIAGICFTCGKHPRRINCAKCEACWLLEQKRSKNYRNDLMKRVIEMYGNVCKCCGELQFEFLTLDHINNDGAQERKERGYRGGYSFYAKLLKLPLRKDIQVLCFNCNLAKQRCGGVCPHKQGSALL